MIHVYLFTTRHDDPMQEQEEVCAVVSKYLGSEITPQTDGVRIVRCQAGEPKEAHVLCEFPLASGGGFCGGRSEVLCMSFLCLRRMNLRRTIAGIEEAS